MNCENFLKGTQFEKQDEWNSCEIRVRPRLKCMDGFEISVQASAFHYSTPREDNADHYESVEVGYPTQVEPELIPYADVCFEEEEGIDYTKSVYAFVPIDIVDKILEKHGGFDSFVGGLIS